jgi:hypothetical protein
MSIFQCSGCGCAENTALTHGYFGPRFNPEYAKSRNLLDPNGHYCSSCWSGEWHGKFEQKFYPLKTMETDHEGNLRAIVR